MLIPEQARCWIYMIGFHPGRKGFLIEGWSNYMEKKNNEETKRCQFYVTSTDLVLSYLILSTLSQKHKNMQLKMEACVSWEFARGTSFAKSFTEVWVPNYKWHTATHNLSGSHLHINPWSSPPPQGNVHIHHPKIFPCLFAVHFQVSPHIHISVPLGYFFVF